MSSSYSVSQHAQFLADGRRLEAFDAALARVVRPGATVVDIGSGTGVLAFLACRRGARRVFAIEAGDVVQVAREIAAANGFGERIEFIQEVSTQVDLPVRADVVISEIGGSLPWFASHLPSIIDARQRFLARGGILVPRRDDVWGAVVEAEALYAERTELPGNLGLDLTSLRQKLVNTMQRSPVQLGQLLTAPRPVASLDYMTVQADEADLRATVEWPVTRAGTGHGLSLGINRTFADGVCLSTSPEVEQPEEFLYAPAFFPWSEPVRLAVGDRIHVWLRAKRMGDNYIWAWRTRVTGDRQPAGPKVEFDQSTALAAPLPAEQVRKRKPATCRL